MNEHSRKRCIAGSRRSTIWIGASALLALMGCVQPAGMQWPQWGGPNQDFKADSAGLATEWPEAGPSRMWGREIGEGYSAILADAGRLYTMCRVDDQETVLCLDAKTGETVWEYKYDSSPRKGHEKRFGQGPRATPLISGDRIYTIGVAGKMHCLDKTSGSVIWSVGLWDEFEGNVLPHGYSSSPIAYKDTILALVGGKGHGIVAFNKKDGSVAWKNLDFLNSYSTPRILKIGGQDQLVTFMATAVIGADPNNGELKWQYPQENQWKQNICQPVVTADDYLFISSSDAGSRGLKLTPDGDKTRVEEVWSTRKIQFYHVNSVQMGDYVFGSTGTMGPAFLAVVNIKTGKITWRKRGFAKATCVYADGRMILLDEDGNLGLTTVTPEEFTLHSKVELLDKVAWTVPTIVGKTMFVRNQTEILALDLG
ncbi:MAG: PQQ-binding-like beta-propeller repeat protein [bacterium]|nr:PQQ-binding-like beta-propeller repeat protein [bacterium]